MNGIVWLQGEEFEFPPPHWANEDGVLAAGGVVSPRTLRRAYRSGIFPWPIDRRFPVLWFCPPERFVMELDELRVSRSLRRTIRRAGFEVRFDTAFSEVVEACAEPRGKTMGTWIDYRIAPAYVALHEDTRCDNVSAHSVEAWLDGELVGGLYGVSVGGVFCGESMFARASDASKVALVALVERMRERGYEMLDCQVYTEHLESLGAREIPRSEYLSRLESNLHRDCQLVSDPAT